MLYVIVKSKKLSIAGSSKVKNVNQCLVDKNLCNENKNCTLKIIAYNVNGLNNKFDNLDLFEYLWESDIFILLETHVENSSFEKFNGKFKNFNIKWKSATRNSRFGRGIGGYVFGIRKNLTNFGVKFEMRAYGSVDTMVVKLNSKNFTIIPAYLRGANWGNEFEDLVNALLENEIINPIIMGDLNVRIGEEQQYLDEILENSFKAGLSGRKSMDKVVKPNGKTFIDFCNNYGLLILNGRTAGDGEGCYTYVGSSGNSVNDICAVSLDILTMVEKFTVDNQTWSDHLPITLYLNFTTTQNDKRKMNLLPKLKWNYNNKDNYCANLNSNLNEMQKYKDNFNLSDMSKLIVESYKVPKINGKHIQFKNKWFDIQCNNARQKSLAALQKFRISQDDVDKEKYTEKKNNYQTICKTKKVKYYKQLEQKLNSVTDSKKWWLVAKEIRQEERLVGNNISAESFKEYFEMLLNPQSRALEMEYAANLVVDTDLDKVFTLQEIRLVLAKVKENKAPGEDRIPYEFFINASNNFLSALAKVFTNILNGSGSFEVFERSIVFPIHKKGDANMPCNYRGISFMNCLAKIMMGAIHERLTQWTTNYKTLNEFQAGFRKGYSTIDNIYNLTAIVNIKFHEHKRVYAFFVDFKAAFDRIPRQLLMYKLRQMGLSTKIVNFLEHVYKHTFSAVWTGDEISDYFSTNSGVKQGCLLSPLLFSLYLNDLHEQLEGGLFIDELNIRILMYADDIVILAENISVLQRMINNLEIYCETWGMEVNLTKSEIMVFRKGGRVALNEKWKFKGDEVKVVSQYKYLGIILTPAMSYTKHIITKNDAAKVCVNITWKSFIAKRDVSLKAKWKLFQAVCRSIQAYGAQVWGLGWFDIVDKLQRFFTKRMLKLPENTPNYVLALETGQEDAHLYTYSLHLQYISKTLFEYENHRLPHRLSSKIISKNIYWYKNYVDRLNSFDLNSNNIHQSKNIWNNSCKSLIDTMKSKSSQNYRETALKSQQRIYKFLDHSKGLTYCNEKYNQHQISLIMKTRGDLLMLNSNKYTTNQSTLCSLCNLNEDETILHFIGRCPILANIRRKFLVYSRLTDYEIYDLLNGGREENWSSLYLFVKNALTYRKFLVDEYNFNNS